MSPEDFKKLDVEDMIKMVDEYSDHGISELTELITPIVEGLKDEKNELVHISEYVSLFQAFGDVHYTEVCLVALYKAGANMKAAFFAAHQVYPEISVNPSRKEIEKEISEKINSATDGLLDQMIETAKPIVSAINEMPEPIQLMEYIKLFKENGYDDITFSRMLSISLAEAGGSKDIILLAAELVFPEIIKRKKI